MTDDIYYPYLGSGKIYARTAGATAAGLLYLGNASKLEISVKEDKQKLKVLAKKYKVENTYLFDEMETCFQKQEIDALYIATPNDHHKEIVELAAKYKINVLCEKPMAVTLSDCLYMDQAAKKNNIKLMILLFNIYTLERRERSKYYVAHVRFELTKDNLLLPLTDSKSAALPS